MVCERSDVFASACAIARAFPLFTRRSASSRRKEKKHVTVEFITVGQDNGPLEISTLEVMQKTKSVSCDVFNTVLFVHPPFMSQTP